MKKPTVTITVPAHEAMRAIWLVNWATAAADLFGGQVGARLAADGRAAQRLITRLATALDDDRPKVRGRCRYCGCTQQDCSGCVERTGDACTWAAPDVCSACVPVPPTDNTVSAALEREAAAESKRRRRVSRQ